jgi:shikimate 5-dehydrogenase
MPSTNKPGNCPPTPSDQRWPSSVASTTDSSATATAPDHPSSTAPSSRSAIVTGAGGRISRAVACALGNDGATVWAVGRTEARLHKIVPECVGRGRAYPADLTQDGDVDQLARDAERKFGRLDILIHSAGTIERGAIADSPTESSTRNSGRTWACRTLSRTGSCRYSARGPAECGIRHIRPDLDPPIANS